MFYHTVLNGMVQRGREGEEERGGGGWILGRLMTSGLSKDIWCHV